MTLEFEKLVPVAEMRGEDDEETHELREMLDEARAYLLLHDWCEEVFEAHLGFGVGGVVAVFLLRAKLKTGDEELLWVVEGDLPSAYLVTDRARNAAIALEIYTDLLEDWARAVREGAGLQDVFPLDAPADDEHAALVETRVRLLRRDIIPAAVRAMRSRS